MKHVSAGALDVAYFEVGPADGEPVILLHGFPYDAHAYDEVSVLLAAAGKRCIVPFLRGYGPTRFLNEDSVRSGQQAALGADLKALMDALDLPTAVLAGYDWGGRAACLVAALWPERVRGLVSCGTAYNLHNVRTARRPSALDQESRHWYWYFLNAERGRTALVEDRRRLCGFLWTQWSPGWKFTDALFERTAASFDNPDFAAVVIHSYRHRIGEVIGDTRLDHIEQRLAEQPVINVPTSVLQGGDDGVDPPQPFKTDAAHFGGGVRHRILSGIGHNVPQEAPRAFADAVLALIS
ncbi:alpha/beta fold hydrolase [Lichenicoccus sp.]|uniref:alpha/beta fold hydrolase n=1 Tax=Lichenicoccus sp. TaxID=2781899 RepID=UPI003D108FD3